MTHARDESILIGGIEKREIRIVDYDPAWVHRYQAEERTIRRALGDTLLRIEHVGSTSVPGLAAKPIIDALVLVRDSADEASYLSQLETAGYELRVREPDFHEHRMLRTPARDVHVHVYSSNASEVLRILAFRDRIRSNAGDRARYEQVKRSLAAREWPDTNAYADAKTEVIESILAGASADGQLNRPARIASAWTELDAERLATSFRKLLRHSDPERLALTGGVAIDLGLVQEGHPATRSAIADLDFVIQDPAAIAPEVASDFLIFHYHAVQPGGGKFLLQLVDPESKIRLEIFPDLAGSLETARCVTVGDVRFKVLSLESIFEHKLQTLARTSSDRTVDPKHLRDARLLGEVLGRSFPSVPPASLARDLYGGPSEFECDRCDGSRNAAFPLARKELLLELLGWSGEKAHALPPHEIP